MINTKIFPILLFASSLVIFAANAETKRNVQSPYERLLDFMAGLAIGFGQAYANKNIEETFTTNGPDAKRSKEIKDSLHVATFIGAQAALSSYYYLRNPETAAEVFKTEGKILATIPHAIELISTISKGELNGQKAQLIVTKVKRMHHEDQLTRYEKNDYTFPTIFGKEAERIIKNKNEETFAWGLVGQTIGQTAGQILLADDQPKIEITVNMIGIIGLAGLQAATDAYHYCPGDQK